MNKRIFAFLLALVMVFQLVSPAIVSADDVTVPESTQETEVGGNTTGGDGNPSTNEDETPSSNTPAEQTRLLGTGNEEAVKPGDKVTISVNGEYKEVYFVYDGFYQDGRTYDDAKNFYIDSLNGLKYFRDWVNGCEYAMNHYYDNEFLKLTLASFASNNGMAGKNVYLLSDIDLTGEVWQPIGPNSGAVADKFASNWKAHFYGNFYGGNHVIKNMDTSKSVQGDKYSRWPQGFFGSIAANGTVIDGLIFENATVVSKHVGGYAGVVVGDAGSNPLTISNCVVRGTIEVSGGYSGAIVGIGNVNVLNCTVTGNSNSTINGDLFAGGLVGAERCSSNLSVSGNYVSDVKITGSQFVSTLLGAMAAGASGIVSVRDNKVKSVSLNGTAVAPAETAATNPLFVKSYPDATTQLTFNNNEIIIPIVVNTNTGTQYSTLAAAVAAVPADGTETTITMLANETIDVSGYAITVAKNKNVVLDLNGKEVIGSCTSGDTSALICNLGTLTINDSKSGGKLIGGATPTWTWDGSDNYSGSYASNVIRNEGTLVVNGGTLYNVSTGSAAYAIDNYSAGKVTVNGGTIDAKKASAIRLFYNDGGSIDVKGGKIGHYTNDDDCCLMGIQVMNGDNADVTISGGTVDGNYSVYSNGTKDSSVTISGGTFPGYVGLAASVGSNKISITGGTFGAWVGTWGDQTGFISGGIYSKEPAKAYVADGYRVLNNTDPTTKVAYPYVVALSPTTPTAVVESEKDSNNKEVVTATIDAGYITDQTAQPVEFSVSGSDVSVTFDAEAAAKIADNAGDSNLILKIEDVTDTGVTSNTKTYEITMVKVENVSGVETTAPVFSDGIAAGKATVTVPYDGSVAPHVFLVEDSGITRIEEVTFDSEKQTVSFTVEHFSTYDVVNADCVASYTANNGIMYTTTIAEAVTAAQSSSNKAVVLLGEDGLKAFAEYVNGGHNGNGITFQLDADIDLSGETWAPIGKGYYHSSTYKSTNGLRPGSTPFAGTFDGQNHKISNLNVSTSGEEHNGWAAGLFGLLNGGTVKNLTIENATVSSATRFAGAVAGGVIAGSIENCKVTGAVSISGRHFVGGITGLSYDEIKDCEVTATGTISADDPTGEDGDDVGGIVGYIRSSSTLTNCSADSANLTVQGLRQVGAVVGMDDGCSNDSGNTSNAKVVITITNEAQLRAFAAAVNAGNTYEGITVKLTADIALTEAWTSIGNGAEDNPAVINGSNGSPVGSSWKFFSGTFDGNGKKISGLNGGSLFGAINGATIQDLTVNGATISSGSFLGAVAGYAYDSTLSNVDVTGTLNISGQHFVGGAVGYAAKTTLNDVDVTATGTISATDPAGQDGDDIGGVVGYTVNATVLTDCDVTGITISALRQGGGLVGLLSANSTVINATVSNVTINCQTTQAVVDAKGESKIAFGGLAGAMNGNVAINTASVSGVTFTATNVALEHARIGKVTGGTYSATTFAVDGAQTGSNVTISNVTLPSGCAMTPADSDLISGTQTVDPVVSDTVYGYVDANNMFLYDSLMFHTYIKLTEAGEALEGVKLVVQYVSDPRQNTTYTLSELTKDKHGTYDITLAVRPRHLYKGINFQLQKADGTVIGIGANSTDTAKVSVDVCPNDYLGRLTQKLNVVAALRAYANAAVEAWGDGPVY